MTRTEDNIAILFVANISRYIHGRRNDIEGLCSCFSQQTIVDYVHELNYVYGIVRYLSSVTCMQKLIKLQFTFLKPYEMVSAIPLPYVWHAAVVMQNSY